MNNAEANRPIANRFFEAFDALVAMGKIKSVRSYCDPNGVDRRNMELLRKDPTRNLLQPSVSYTHLRAHETLRHLVCRLLH